MGEENRGSSGGGTVMIVLAILGGILVVGCCGGIVAVGLLGTLTWSSAPAPAQMQMQPPLAVPTAPELAPEVTKALDDLNKELEPLKIAPEDTIPSVPGGPPSEKPEVVPPPEEQKE
ncbi:MAG: hypothetical protein ACKVP0_20435 [Pirellulaceae bacterium]